MKLDEINIQILRLLKYGRESFSTIAETLGLTENTVRARVKKLESEGILGFQGVIDAEKIPTHQIIIIGVKLVSPDLFKKGKEFADLKGVSKVSVVTGRYDLIIEALFNEEFGLPEFYTEEVVKIEGISSMETFVVYKGFNQVVPYVL
ncbi:MAG: Lrp/AsnC family transcriptional regulator [Desulforegulaceae bacterium]|nr:Lrp/AsnC family transcriptional regulator [Desulforegulaceae bacterium]